MVDQEKTETALVLRTEPGPLATLEVLIKGTVKVHGSLLVQAFLAPVYKKGNDSQSYNYRRRGQNP